MAVLREIFEKEVIKGFNEAMKDTFLDGTVDKSRYVTGDDEAQVIHSSYFGVFPDVLINNVTYPIGIQDLNATDIVVKLDKYQTKATPITDDELYALTYDKITTVKESHVEAIVTNRLMGAIHAIAPLNDTLKTPVLLTTGDATTDGLRKRLLWADIIAMRERMQKAGIPINGMRLVLSDEHVNDLLLLDESFQKLYVNRVQGIIPNQLGFEIREYSANPLYNVDTKTKLSLGAIGNDASDRQASVIFPVKRIAKALGKTKMYYSESKTDPLTQRNLINFRNHFIAMPMLNEGIGTIVSNKA